MKSFSYIQAESAECGLAALAASAALLGAEYDLAVLRARFPVSSRGSTLKDLVEVAANLNLVTRAVRCEIADLPKLQRPAILHWGLNHFVVLKSISRRGAHVFNPAKGWAFVDPKGLSDKFTGVALEITRAPTFQRRREKSPLSMASLVQLSPSMIVALSQAFFLSLLLQAYVVASPFYMQMAIDQAAVKGDLDLLGALAVGFLGFALFNALAEALRSVVLQQLSAKLNWDLSVRLFRHLIRLPLPWFKSRRLADVLARFQSLDPLRNLIAGGFVGTVIDGLLSIVTVVMMFIFSLPLAVVTLVGFSLSVASKFGALPFSRRYASESMMSAIAEQGKRMETLRAIQTIKSMVGETGRENVWANKLAASIRATQRSSYVTIVTSSVQRVVDATVVVAIIYMGARSVMEGALTVGMLYAFVAYRAQFVARATSLIDQAIAWRMMDLYTHRLADIVLTPMENPEGTAVGNTDQFKGNIWVDRVSFRYSQSDPWILKEVSLKIAPGEFVAVTGASGCGKSTLMRIICGLYPPSAGEVLFDGFPLSAWGPAATRRSLGIVMQDDELLPGSIADNVTFFAEETDTDHLWACLEAACVADDVRHMPMREHTLVGADMGSSVSGGQRQRLLLARALYKRPVALMLDEATSQIDLLREQKISDWLRKHSITRLVIAHRPATIAMADKTYHLADGVLKKVDVVREPERVIPSLP